jgi:hypothetical protein
MEPVKVRVRDCPTGLHNGEGDWVALSPTLSLDGGLAAEQDLQEVSAKYTDPAERAAALQRRWVLTFIRYGARGWNFHDEAGDEIDFDPQALLDDYAIGRPVAEKAADLYSDSVLRPFQTRLATRSPTGRTTATTSKARSRTRARSGPSSPATSAASAQ